MSRAHELAQAVREWAPHFDFKEARLRGFRALAELERMAEESETGGTSAILDGSVAGAAEEDDNR